MRKVITHGITTFTAICDVCGCCFEYDIDDVSFSVGGVAFVICPECKQHLVHKSPVKEAKPLDISYKQNGTHIVYDWDEHKFKETAGWEITNSLNFVSPKDSLPDPFVSVLLHIPDDSPLPTLHEGYLTNNNCWQVLHGPYAYEINEVDLWSPMPEINVFKE